MGLYCISGRVGVLNCDMSGFCIVWNYWIDLYSVDAEHIFKCQGFVSA